MTRAEMIAKLNDAQNHDAHMNQDICTIVHCMNSDEQILAHLTRALDKIERFEAKPKRGRR